jgi:hypothetical protein
MAELTVFTVEQTALTYTDKKGALHGITAEGACFKGGAAMAALKDLALDSALAKSVNGRYRAASDILCAAFPSIGKAAEKLIGTPWANKSTMGTLINAVMHAEPGKSGSFSLKQDKARALASTLMQLPAFCPVEEKETVGETV